VEDRAEFDMPWPPSVNKCCRAVPARRRGGGSARGVRVPLSRGGRAYRREACARLAAWRRGKRPMAGRLAVTVELLPPTRRAIDIDNRIKALLDALQHGGVLVDDGQVDRLTVERGPVTAGGGARVLVERVQTGGEPCN